jgi:nucleotide-binding universal stress UspA family protein
MKVLLGIDPSTASQAVTDTAVERPWPRGTSFAIIHIVDLASFARVPALIEEEKRSAQIFVKGAAEKIAATGHPVTSDVFIGLPRRDLSRYAKDWGAELIMVGSHGQGALKRFLIGSVAQAALRTAPCSVEIVRRREHRASIGVRALKILVATDGSECSAAAVKSVASRPWPAGTEARIVSVVQLLVPENESSASSLSAVYPASLVEELINDARTRARDAVAYAKKTLAEAGLKVTGKDATPIGDPRDAVLEMAKQWEADLIVLGSHGWKGLDRMLIGSVSESVALHANCSVEVVRA